jgi:hypothetical protein
VRTLGTCSRTGADAPTELASYHGYTLKNISTGFGLALLAGAILAYPFVSSLAPTANASAVSTAASAVSTAVTGQTGPTIVWYGVSQGSSYDGIVTRAWSDGRVEALAFDRRFVNCKLGPTLVPTCGWQVLSTPAQGYTYRSDINFDAKVDGADLGQLLADWGDAPRQDIPPSDCPLALINP